MAKRASLGLSVSGFITLKRNTWQTNILQGFMKKLPNTITMGIRIEPSSSGVTLSHVIPLSNSIYIEGNELEIPRKMQPAPDHIKSCIRDRLIQNNYVVGSFSYKGYNDKDNSARHERNLIAQTVQQELNLAIATLIEDKVISSIDLCKAVNYSEVKYCVPSQAITMT
jgi:hypothetical protein